MKLRFIFLGLALVLLFSLAFGGESTPSSESYPYHQTTLTKVNNGEEWIGLGQTFTIYDTSSKGQFDFLRLKVLSDYYVQCQIKDYSNPAYGTTGEWKDVGNPVRNNETSIGNEYEYGYVVSRSEQKGSGIALNNYRVTTDGVEKYDKVKADFIARATGGSTPIGSAVKVWYCDPDASTADNLAIKRELTADKLKFEYNSKEKISLCLEFSESYRSKKVKPSVWLENRIKLFEYNKFYLFKENDTTGLAVYNMRFPNNEQLSEVEVNAGTFFAKAPFAVGKHYLELRGTFEDTSLGSFSGVIPRDSAGNIIYFEITSVTGPGPVSDPCKACSTILQCLACMGKEAFVKNVFK